LGHGIHGDAAAAQFFRHIHGEYFNGALGSRVGREMTALGRVGLPDDIGPMIASLLGPDNRWVTGQRIEAVSIAPGATVFTVMPRLPSSFAIYTESISTAPLALA
jgi:NAD(P)-dependent dehydrogenase (short-subunit alcohol dehydrogenase family)